MKRFTALIALLVSFNSHAVLKIWDGDEEAGDYVAFTLPVMAMTLSMSREDWAGAVYLSQGLVTSQVLTGLIKDHIPRTRPNGNCCASQASGHVASSFATAAYLHERYGFWHGVFGYTAATYVGFTRVDADKHYVDDVLLSALFGAASSYYFTDADTPKNFQILPTFDGDSAGIFFAYRF